MNSKLVAILISAVLLNFIIGVYGVPPDTLNNVCALSNQESGRTLGNGTQDKNGICQETFMGEIPDFDHMVSTVIIFPKNNDVIEANKNFTFQQKVLNLRTGFFDDPAKQYYLFPQTLDKDGFIQGHSHVSIQKLGDEGQVPDARVFAFFKGLNEKADNDNILSTVVGSQQKAGLDPGFYRVCTMTSSFAHQPTLMPVAQRGPQDDCVRFTVKDGYKKRSVKKSTRKVKRYNRK